MSGDNCPRGPLSGGHLSGGQVSGDICPDTLGLPIRDDIERVAVYFQSALGIHDLGQFYYIPVNDEASGATLLVTVRTLDDARAFDSTNVRWLSLKKAQARGSAKATSPAVETPGTTGESASTDRPRSLLDGAHDMIVHRHLSGQLLPRGLYVGLLQLRSTRDSISVLVSRHNPNVLPYVKVRDNPNVTRYHFLFKFSDDRFYSCNSIFCM